MKKVLSLTLLALSLVGCGIIEKKEEKIVVKEYVFVQIPSSLLTPIDPTIPPLKEDFKASHLKSKDEKMLFRLELLGSLSNSLYSDINRCNLKLEKIKELSDKSSKELNKDKDD